MLKITTKSQLAYKSEIPQDQFLRFVFSLTGANTASQITIIPNKKTVNISE
ncbi:MAG: hypothetical protein ACN4GM_07810 [Gammaproteobacteria bacterium]